MWGPNRWWLACSSVCVVERVAERVSCGRIAARGVARLEWWWGHQAIINQVCTGELGHEGDRKQRRGRPFKLGAESESGRLLYAASVQPLVAPSRAALEMLVWLPTTHKSRSNLKAAPVQNQTDTHNKPRPVPVAWSHLNNSIYDSRRPHHNYSAR